MDYKRCWAAVDLAALSHNYHCIRRFLSPGCRYLAIVKADGYGHGAATVAGQLQKDGADWFGVATMEEALDLRRQGIYRPILVLGYTDPAAAPILASNTITQTLFSEEYALQLAAEAAKAGCVVDCHVKIDTGMSRLGFYFQDIERDKEAVSVVAEACRRPGLIPEGIFTHFAVADGGENGKAFTLKQFSCFMALIAELEKPGRDPRDELPSPILRSDIKDMKDLKPGMKMRGTVRNVIDFGVFVDIGVHQDGLVHISQVSNKFIKHPSEVVSVGDVVKVAVLDVDQKRGRISLTMKGAK